MLRKVDRVLLRVPALEGAVRYYRDVLGMTLIRHDARIASFRLSDHSELVLHADPDLPGEAIYFLVDDVRDLFRRREQLKLQFVEQPAPVARGHRATVKDAFGNILLLIDRGAASPVSTAVEDAKPAGGLFPGVEQRVAARADILIALYEKIGRTADDLPYTPHFESLFESYVARYGSSKPTRQEVWRHLLNLRKAGKLPKLGEARSTPPDVSAESRAQLREMLGKDLGKRDRLPYSARFDALVDQFNRSQPRPLSPHLVWRLVATIAK